MPDPNEVALKRNRAALERVKTMVMQGMWPACGDTEDSGLIERWGVPYDKAPFAETVRRTKVVNMTSEDYKWIPLWAVLAVNPEMDMSDNPFSHVFHSLTENKGLLLALKLRLDSYMESPRNRIILLSDFRMKSEAKLKQEPLLGAAWEASLRNTMLALEQQK